MHLHNLKTKYKCLKNFLLSIMLITIVIASILIFQKLFFMLKIFIENSVISVIKQNDDVIIFLIFMILDINLARNILFMKNHIKKDKKKKIKFLIVILISRMLLFTMIIIFILTITIKYVSVNILNDSILIIICFLLIETSSALQLTQIC